MNIRVSSACINFLLRFFYYLRDAINDLSENSEFCEGPNVSKLPQFFNNVVLNRKIPSPGFDEE